MASFSDSERVSAAFLDDEHQDPSMRRHGQERADRRKHGRKAWRSIARCVPFIGGQAAAQQGMLYDYLGN